jgi:hypothetical protein
MPGVDHGTGLHETDGGCNINENGIIDFIEVSENILEKPLSGNHTGDLLFGIRSGPAAAQYIETCPDIHYAIPQV